MKEMLTMFSPQNMANMGETAKRLSEILADIYKELHELNLNLKEYNLLRAADQKEKN
jgi:hypothetical protein